MGPCYGYSCLSRSLERQDEQETREEQESRQASAAGAPWVVGAVAPLAAPARLLAAGTPLEIILAALAPLGRAPR